MPAWGLAMVSSVDGASAGAGSAEFHIYRNNRRKEMKRLEWMDYKAIMDELDEEYLKKKKEKGVCCDILEKKASSKNKKKRR